MEKKVAVAAPDDGHCAECAKDGREEPLNVTVRHSGDGLHTYCTRMRWCFVCGTGGGMLIDCEG